jgi:hypothetical protein
MVYKESPLCCRCSAFGHKSAESLLACLINLLPESFGALSVSVTAFLQHFWRLAWNLEGGVFTSLSPVPCHQPTRRATPARLPPDHVDLGEGASLPVSQGGKLWLHKGTWKGLGTNLGAPLFRLVRTQVQIQACLRRQKGSLINS